MHYRLGFTFCLAAGILWSLNGLAIRLIDSAGTWAVLGWRSLGAVLVLGAWIWASSRGRPFAQLRAAGRFGVIGGVALVVAFAGAIYAYQATTVANAAFLLSAQPLMAALLGRALLDEPVHRVTWMAIALAVLGVFLMVRDNLGLGALSGNLAALALSAGFAVFTISLRAGRVAETMPVSFLGALFSVMAAAAVLAAQGEPLLPGLHDTILSLGMGVVLIGGGMALYTLGSRAVPAGEAALLAQGEVVLAPVWAWIVLDETVNGATLLGGTILLGALFMNGLAGMRRAARAGA